MTGRFLCRFEPWLGTLQVLDSAVPLLKRYVEITLNQFLLEKQNTDAMAKTIMAIRLAP